MAFELPKLPYDYVALEPYIDEQTMILHHTKHHQGYIDNLNKALKDYSEFNNKSIEEILGNVDKIPEKIRQTVINNGGGFANHSFFWKIMTPESTKPEGEFLDALDSTFGLLDKFKEEFTNKAMSLFGSGWVFLIMTNDGKLKLKRHSFQNSPLMYGCTPVLGIDLWEHAYYLRYQNRRLDYIQAWWNVVNWKQAEENFNKAKH